MKTRVAVVRCPSYEEARLRDAVGRSLELIGGLEAVIRPGSKVFVKINHLSPGSPPERAIVTHPPFLYSYISGELVLSPAVVPASCTGCEECFRICPRRAVVTEGGWAARLLGSLFRL